MSDETVEAVDNPAPALLDADFMNALERIINAQNRENESNTPDYVLAGLMFDCLRAFDHAIQARTSFYENGSGPAEQQRDYLIVENDRLRAELTQLATIVRDWKESNYSGYDVLASSEYDRLIEWLDRREG